MEFLLSPTTIPALYEEELAILWSEPNVGELGLDVLGPGRVNTCSAAKVAGIFACSASLTAEVA
jgi:hypothetical protein